MARRWRRSIRVRFHAAIALGKLQDPKAVKPLFALIEENDDEDAFLRHAAVMGLAGSAQADPKVLLQTTSSPNSSVRLAAILALRRHAYPGISSFLKDGDLYRMYYRGAGPRTYTCYAESDDGVNWIKPELGLIEIDGSVKNNAIVSAGPGISFCPFKDKKPGIPNDELYKANARDVSQPKGGLLCYVSGDGIHWNQISEKPVVPYEMENNFDSQNVLILKIGT